MSNIKQKISKDFGNLKDKVLAILIYGSFANRYQTVKSDIDICIVSGDKEKAKEIYQKTLAIQRKNQDMIFTFLS